MLLRLLRSTGMVQRYGVRSAERHQTALRGQAAFSLRERRRLLSASNASETSPCRRAGQAKRRARPPQGDGFQQAQAGGIETSIAAGQLPSAASAQLVCTRSSGPIGGGRSTEVDQVSPGAGVRANPTVRGQACAAARRAGLTSHKNVARSRSPSAPVRRVAPDAGPVVASS